jgi:hypothetical protein
MALNSNEKIKKLLKEGKILAYADDLIIQLKTKEEAHVMIKELKKLEKWNLKMNKKKSQLLVGKKMKNKWIKKGVKNIEGVDFHSEVKYLGIQIGFEKHILQKRIKDKIR